MATILLVEDDRDFRECIADVLDPGHAVVQAADGADALRAGIGANELARPHQRQGDER